MKQALVIEDQKPVRESIGELLKFTGCQVRLVGDGQAALENLLSVRYDLITLDLNMPSLDGLSLVETLFSQEGPNTRTPFIVISAYLSPDTMDTLRQFGIRHFLPKPFESDELLDLVQSLI